MAAAIDGREAVNDEDYKIVDRLLKPLKYEALVMDKRDFESERHMDSARLAILTEMVTYGQFTLEQLANDYHIPTSTAYRLMEDSCADWEIVNKHPVTYAPSPELTEKIRQLGLNGAHPQ